MGEHLGRREHRWSRRFAQRRATPERLHRNAYNGPEALLGCALQAPERHPSDATSPDPADMRIILALIIAAALAVGGYYLFWPRGGGPGGPGGHVGPPGGGGAGMPVEAATVRSETLVRSIPAVGTLHSIESVVVRPEIAGRIEKIAFREGERVEAGSALLTLDDSILRAQLAEARASLQLSKANYQRANELFQKKVGSAQARDQALANMRVDEARVAVAEAQLDKTTIRAPFAGIVGLRKVSPGDYATAGQDIVNLEKIDVLKADFSVPELALPEVAEGQTVNVTVDAFPGRTFKGNVHAIDPLIDARGRSIAIRAHIDNPDNLLRPGLFARIELVVAKTEGALLVPEEAIVPVGEDRFVFRIVDGKAMMTRVRTGARRPGEVQITEGLKAGQQVVTAGQIKLRDGIPVSVVPAAAPPGPRGSGGSEENAPRDMQDGNGKSKSGPYDE